MCIVSFQDGGSFSSPAHDLNKSISAWNPLNLDSECLLYWIKYCILMIHREAVSSKAAVHQEQVPSTGKCKQHVSRKSHLKVPGINYCGLSKQPNGGFGLPRQQLDCWQRENAEIGCRLCCFITVSAFFLIYFITAPWSSVKCMLKG